MHPNAQLLERFYFAFKNRDWKTMAECYTPDAIFQDPVFRELRGWEIGAMWRMLCERGTDLELTFGDIQADDLSGSAHWEARYTFSKTKRKVHNVIDARFDFRGGLILQHKDHFSLWRWLGMAIGPAGKVLGWLPTMQNAVRLEARHGLEKFVIDRGIVPPGMG
ncbi:nuclear transport factor 2 family protein [Myxococcota bacterium]|nr:nuclear transport factor 2 family protein [Myxococcota bacterium]